MGILISAILKLAAQNSTQTLARLPMMRRRRSGRACAVAHACVYEQRRRCDFLCVSDTARKSTFDGIDQLFIDLDEGT